MIEVQAAFLSNAASVEANGLVSLLGAFVEVINTPQLPIRHQLWFVARLTVEEEDMDSPHSVVVTVENSDGTEPLARIEGSAPALVERGMLDPDVPTGMPVVIPMFLEFRREGLYYVRLVVDGEMMWEGRLKVRRLLPQI